MPLLCKLKFVGKQLWKARQIKIFILEGILACHNMRHHFACRLVLEDPLDPEHVIAAL